ncbi:hypothetical protein ACVWXL_007883 [Bradyrhizobium sp. GM22.5]
MRFRHADIVEESLAERRVAGDQEDRFGRHALRGHVEQDEADAVMLLRGGIGANEAEDPVGVVGIGGPDLRPRNDEIIAVALGAGLQRGEIGAGVRLGIALTPADQARGDLWQMLLLLGIVAVFQQRRPEHPDTRSSTAGAARRSWPSPRAAPCAPRRLSPHRHIPSASPVRSSPCRACVRTRCVAARTKILRYVHPRTRRRRTSRACAFPAGNWLPTRRAFRCGMFRDRRSQSRWPWSQS